MTESIVTRTQHRFHVGRVPMMIPLGTRVGDILVQATMFLDAALEAADGTEAASNTSAENEHRRSKSLRTFLELSRHMVNAAAKEQV